MKGRVPMVDDGDIPNRVTHRRSQRSLRRHATSLEICSDALEIPWRLSKIEIDTTLL